MALRQNVWSLDEWYAQAVQGDGSTDYSAYTGFYVWGANNGGFGNNDQDVSKTPITIPGSSWGTVLSMGMAGQNTDSVGYINYVGTNDQLRTWGRNEYGQLGLGNNTNKSSTQYVSNGWSYVSSGAQHMCGVKTDGTLWCWGLNENGALAQNNRANRNEPYQVGTDTNWQQVECGNQTSMATKTDGTLWSWGRNDYGELGDNSKTKRSSPVQVGSATDWSNARLSGGQTSMSGVKTDGTGWVWGANHQGQMGLGQPDNAERTTPHQVPGTWGTMDVGYWSMIGAKTDGTLYCWGRNEVGQLGQNNTSLSRYPAQVGTSTDWASHRGACSMGDKQGGACKQDGTLWMWGEGDSGRLGQDNETDYSSPRQVGTDTDYYSVCLYRANSRATKFF